MTRSRFSIVTLILMVLSTGAGAQVPPANTHTPVPRLDHRQVTMCPDDNSLVAAIRTLLGLPANADIRFACAPGFFPMPGWWMDVYVYLPGDRPGDEEGFNVGLVMAATSSPTVIAQGEQTSTAPVLWDADVRSSLEAVDLDGDGIDEVVWDGGEAFAQGICLQLLRVLGLSAGRISTLLELPLLVDTSCGYAEPPDVYRCNVDVQVAPAADGSLRLAANGTETGVSPEAPCVLGHHEWRLVDGVLEEAPPSEGSGALPALPTP